MSVSDDTEIAAAIVASLDDLLLALDMEQVGVDHFRVPSDVAQMFDRIYGGQLLAQALIGAGATVEGKAAHSLHVAFVRAGVPGRPIEVVVSRAAETGGRWRHGRFRFCRTVKRSWWGSRPST